MAAYLAQRYFSGKSRPGWQERWGRLPDALHCRPEGKPRIWIHAVSAGEVVAAVPILRELRARLPEHELLLSVITLGGHEMAMEQAAKFVDAIFYSPFDLPWIARRVVQTIRPQVFVSLESELWPNVLHELKRHGTATIMVNGRISEKNYRRATRFGGGLFRWMLGNMDRLLMQSAADAERVRSLGGGLTEPGRVAVLGNSKFDQEIARLSPEQVLAKRRDLRLPENAPVFVAGSTRSPEEEAEVIAAYKTLRERVPELCLLLAPRHKERAGEIVSAMQSAGLSPVRRTQLKDATPPAPQGWGETGRSDAPQNWGGGGADQPGSEGVRHLILDTMGELADVYAVATFAFVGNSFPPVVKGGGQNLLQPLAHGKPVLFGPYTATIRSEVALVTEAGVGFQVADGAALAAEGLRLLENVALRQEIEVRALDLIAANRGVSARYAAAVEEIAREGTGNREQGTGNNPSTQHPTPNTQCPTPKSNMGRIGP